MVTKLNLDKLPHELAERARTIFGGVLRDLEKLLNGAFVGKSMASKLSRPELVRMGGAIRKSLDRRLAALQTLVAGAGKSAAKKPRKSGVARKAAKTTAKARPRTRVARKR